MSINNTMGILQKKVLRVLGHRYFILYCFILYACVRAILIFFVPVTVTSDAAWYYYQGIAISEGKGYLRNGEPTAYWPIGYPAALALVFTIFKPSILTAQLFNFLVASGSFFIVLALARTITLNENVARLSLFIICIYPNNFAYPSLILTETMFTALLMLGCLVYIRYNTYYFAIAAGIIFGLATLVKSQTLLIPAVLIFFSFLFVEERKFLFSTLHKGLLLYLFLLLTIFPWTYRNYLVFGEVVLLSSNGGMSLLSGNNPGMKPDFINDYNDTDPLVLSMGHPDGDEIKINHKATWAALDWITKNPIRFMELIPHKLFRLWVPDGEAEWAYQDQEFYKKNIVIFRSVRVVNQLYYFGILITVFLTIVLLLRRKITASRWLWIGFVLSIYTSSISILFSGQSRYHFPIMPFIIMYSSYYIIYIASSHRCAKQQNKENC